LGIINNTLGWPEVQNRSKTKTSIWRRAASSSRARLQVSLHVTVASKSSGPISSSSNFAPQFDLTISLAFRELDISFVELFDEGKVHILLESENPNGKQKANTCGQMQMVQFTLLASICHQPTRRLGARLYS